MIFYLSKSLLPIAVLCSYLLIPAFAQEDSVETQEPVMEESATPGQRGELCEISSEFLKNHTEFHDLEQGNVFVQGTEFDVSRTALRLVPKDQNCSKEARVGTNTCMVCRENRSSVEKPMVVVSGPMKTTGAPRTRLLVCPTGVKCNPWLVTFPMPQGLGLSCLYSENPQGPPRQPMKEPIQSSILLATGILIKVPCDTLKAQSAKPSRRPW